MALATRESGLLLKTALVPAQTIERKLYIHKHNYIYTNTMGRTNTLNPYSTLNQSSDPCGQKCRTIPSPAADKANAKPL